jgi:hypothetical protein
VRLERRGSEAGVGTEAGDGGSGLEAEDTGFGGGCRGHRLWGRRQRTQAFGAEAEGTGFAPEADACPRKRPT